MSVTFDVVLNEDDGTESRFSLPDANTQITLHPDAADFAGTIQELASVRGARVTPTVGRGYETVDVDLDVVTVIVFVPDALMNGAEDDGERDRLRLARVQELISEATS